MAKVESTVTIARSVEEVFRFFIDLDTNAQDGSEPRSPIFARIGQKVWDQRLARIKRALEL